MDVNFACPRCGKRLALERECVGRKVRCPYCNSVYPLEETLIEGSHRGMVIRRLPDDQSRSNHQEAAKTFDDGAPVGFWARVAAAFIDGIVVTLATIVVGVVIVVFGTLMALNMDYESLGELSSIVIPWLYFSLMESSAAQASLGKMAIGARVVDVNGNRITFGRATGRHFAKCLSGLFFCVGYIMVAFDERKRGLHDLMAGTRVVFK